jgi:hypothetical protein
MSQIKVRNQNGETVFYLLGGGPLTSISAVRYGNLGDSVFTVTKKGGEYRTTCILNGRVVHLSLKDAIEKHKFTVYLVS